MVFRFAAVLMMALFGTGTVLADTAVPDGYKNADLLKGGQMYDNWQAFTHKKPQGTNPLYPAKGTFPQQSWSCNECHGWDYKGKDGLYSTGPHATGIIGIRAAAQKTPQEVFQALTQKNHDFSPYLKEQQLWNLVKFVREGQTDFAKVKRTDGSFTGLKSVGRAKYRMLCVRCHGNTGTLIDLDPDRDGHQGLGTSIENPARVMHKILWGLPGTEMPSLLINLQLKRMDGIDILTYVETLPPEITKNTKKERKKK